MSHGELSPWKAQLAAGLCFPSTSRVLNVHSHGSINMYGFFLASPTSVLEWSCREKCRAEQALWQGRVVVGFVRVPPQVEDADKPLVFCTMSQTGWTKQERQVSSQLTTQATSEDLCFLIANFSCMKWIYIYTDLKVNCKVFLSYSGMWKYFQTSWTSLKKVTLLVLCFGRWDFWPALCRELANWHSCNVWKYKPHF